jgi:hypothetical protein
MRRLERWELLRGLALHLDARVLVANGATFTGGVIGRAYGRHYFVYLGADLWLATSSQAATGRVQIHRKFGQDRGWRDRPTYADMWQVWTIPFEAVRLAALVSDRSQRGRRNYANLECLEAVSELAEAA